jgi:threonine aldolase
MPAMDIVELRSDTFTRPTREMLKAMADAELGDDVWGEDPTAISLQEHCADIFGVEAGLFVPSGTMGNETALKALTNPGDDVIVESRSHVVLYEHGAPSVISGVILRLIDGPDGRLPVGAVRDMIASANEHTSRPTLVWQENTHNASGGRVIPLEHIRAVAKLAHDGGAKAFIDGARIFNASVASGVPVRDYAAEVDALSFCFSKGLGAPVGSMLLGTRELIDRARVIRQMLGGGMRQVGLLCAAARVAVDTMVERLAEDHENARVLAEGFADAATGSVDPSTVETNMVYVDLPGRDVDAIVRSMWDDGVRVGALGPTRVRAVTSKEVDRAGIERAIASFAAAVRDEHAAGRTPAGVAAG